jgi:hypothetical protein
MAHIQTSGFPPPAERVIREAALQVLDVLAYDSAIRFDTSMKGWSGQSVAAATDSGVHFNMARAARELDNPFPLALCTYEETAHFIIGKRGLPHGATPLADFLQELFAGYVEMFLTHRHRHDQLTGIIDIRGSGPGPWDHKGVAKKIGYELAGEERATEILDQWLEAGPDPDVRDFVEKYRVMFVGASSPEDMADRVLNAYTP